MIEARRLRRTLFDGTVILPETSFRVDRGQIAALVGKNGSGKSTLLSCFCGDIPLEPGHAFLAGIDCCERDVLRRTSASALVESTPTSAELTVQEHLALLRSSWAAVGKILHETVRETAEEFALGHLLNSFPHQLSSGQLQCLQLAMTMSRQCDVILLDEPERHLDAEIQGLLLDSLRRRARSGTAILYATHSTSFVEAADVRVSPGSSGDD